jgi:hypothetical protein
VIRTEDRGSRTPNIFTWKCRFYVLFVTGLLYNCYKLYCLMTIKFWIWIWITTKTVYNFWSDNVFPPSTGFELTPLIHHNTNREHYVKRIRPLGH